MKKQTENTFTEGLIQDLHPLTTPNNVLTDALNATLITMNGNEFVLQNDMGNGRVEKAYLPPGYVPVGIKEFGGVIYVASYNPLTNKGQIGSFPSPERNIDQEELGIASTEVKWSDFYSNDDGECSTFIVKTELFGGKIIRSGDKFTIYFDDDENSSNLDDTLRLLSEYNNSKITKADSGDNNYVEDGRAKSPKKNVISIYLTVLDSNNNLRDITSQLKRFEPGSNVPLKFDASLLPIVKNNTGYFIEKLESTPTNVNEAFNSERQKRAVNTYNNKLFGKVYLVVQLNIIDHIDISVYGFRKQGTEWALTDEQKSQINFNQDVGDDDDVLLIFDTDYVYNCPDGFTDGETVENPIPGCSGYQGDYSKSAIKGLEMSSSDQTYLSSKKAILYFPTLSDNEEAIPSDNEETPNYNQINDLYSLKQTAFLPLKFNEKYPIFNYKITPWMTYSPLNGLAVDGSINLSKIGSGENTISTWKYYCDNNQVRLTWGFDSYPVYGTRVTDVTLHFYDVLQSDQEIGSIQVEPRASYNGTFTLNILYGDLIVQNNLYLVLISYQVSSESGAIIEGSERYAGARWLLTNGVFNRAYLTNSSYAMQDYNNFVGDTIANDSSYSDNKYDNHNRYEFVASVKDLIRIDLNSNWSQEVIKHNVSSKDSSGFLYIEKEKFNPGTKYLSKKNVTELDSSLKLTLTDSIDDKYPFVLNTSGITHTFSQPQEKKDKGRISHDSLNIIGNITALEQQAQASDQNIFTADDESEYGSNVIGRTAEEKKTKNWLDITLDSSTSSFILNTNAGIHSQIAGAPQETKITLLNCYQQFLDEYKTFKSVFGFDKRNVPRHVLGFTVHTDGGGFWEDGNHRWYMFNGVSESGGNFVFGEEAIEILVNHHGHSTQVWQFADYLDRISELMNEYLGAPVIAFIGANENNPPSHSQLVYGSDETNKVNNYILMFWRGIDGKYYILDVFQKDDTSICPNIVNSFKNIYIYKDGNSAEKYIYDINVDSPSLVYMNDFQTSIYSNISITWERNTSITNLLLIKGTTNGYLDTLITNTNSIIKAKIEEDKKGLEELQYSEENPVNFDKFISGVWFVVKSSNSEIKEYSDTITVKGTLEDYNTLLSLAEPISNALLGSDGTIHTTDGYKVALNPSSIYYYDSESTDKKVYSVDSPKVDVKYKKLSEIFTVVSYKANSQLLVASAPPVKDLNIRSTNWNDGNGVYSRIVFQGVPTVQLGNSVLNGLAPI